MSGAVLVTGGAKGVGAAIVRALVAGGFDVDFTYSASAGAAAALREELAATGRTIEAHRLDLSDKQAVEAFCATIADKGYAGFVHNAGQSYDTLAALMDQERAEAVMQVNFWSFTRLTKALLRTMLRARTGRIVVVGSLAALRGNAGNAAYAASKGALMSYCLSLAMETAKRNITVNYVAPGFVDTDMLAAYGAFRPKLEPQIPAGRFARPEDVAALVAFLTGPTSGYLTGAVLPVDGGLSATLGIQR